jgi:NhaP-type Na+/H+ or K+/H+ antiporter
LLAIGLPLTVATGFVVARLLYSGVGTWVCAGIAASLAPTDAALGEPITEDERLPRRLRRPLFLGDVTWRAFVFAVIALTLVRMVPVAIALLGTGTDRATVALIGWFGPRGLASVVFCHPGHRRAAKI